MNIELTHQPSYTHVVTDLEAGETILAEPGAMVSHTDSIEIDTTTSRDGLLSSAKSMLGGESAFANEFTATGSSGTVTLAPPTPGDVKHFQLDDETLYAVDGSYLASDPAIDIDSELGGLKTMLGGAGLTPLALKGTGDVLIEAFGGIESVELAADETYTIDNEHLVAWEGSTDFDARRVGGLKSTILSGEGLVLDFTGPGRVWYQTRGLDSFIAALGEIVTGEDDGQGSPDMDFF
ncbi:TIGR00266 family protein [Salinarchaeum laminariae]|uniref:TIGR00266 family protein n=1 Tax=Salinarchaeum laminariae TaxID=869888 RepID=UPI0020BD9355|nr:TIGR00266 family protein [Salinarchaeum laminariae]